MADSRFLLYFERKLICECASMTEALATVMMTYFVFDVQYPAGLANTCNFLDTSVGRIDKKLKVRASVQRKLNIILV